MVLQVNAPHITAVGAALAWLALSPLAVAQQVGGTPAGPESSTAADIDAAPDKLDIQPAARDDQIQQRLQDVLAATGWFERVSVRVEAGVVFLAGDADSPDVMQWAGDLARNTEGVVAVANRLQVPQRSMWDFSPAWNGLREMWTSLIGALPLLTFALVTLALSFFAGVLATRSARKVLQTRIHARLLRSVAAHAAGALVFLVGTYIVLRIAGLTQLALTLVGGTGLVGLALGIAFRNIAENFLASIFLSVQRPFEPGDLVEVAGTTGYVQQLNLRTTVLMNLDGNLVHVPNSTVYGGSLCNFTANPDRRESFEVGIGYDDSVQEAQEILREVLATHPAVLAEPAPMILVDSLGRATVNLRIYFWLDGRAHSWLKVRSSAIRLAKQALQAHGISMPDEAREVIFPQGVPVHMLPQADAGGARSGGDAVAIRPRSPTPSDCSTKAEAGLHSEAGELERQARQTSLRDSENLLRKAPG